MNKSERILDSGNPVFQLPIADCQLPITGGCCLLLAVLYCSGCSLMVHPFHDEYANQPPVTTPSVETARQAQTTRVVQQHDWPPVELHAQSGTVTHRPLYFEDPFEDKGSNDGQLRWTWEDYFQVFYWRGRFLLNEIAFPVSAVVTPPWTVMQSDGYLSRQALGWDHDAEPVRCDGTTTARPVDPPPVVGPAPLSPN